MKQFVCLCLLVCILFLAACTQVDIPPASDPAGAATETTTGTVNETTEAVPETTETIPETTETVPETTETVPDHDTFDPYIVRITQGDFPIYAGAGYSSGCCGSVEKAGSYTIVEETEDDWGILWGRLKSGAGWINLTQLAQDEAIREVLSIVPVTDGIINSGDYHLCSIAFDSHGRQILIKANRNLTNIEVFPLSYLDTQLEQAPKYTQAHWGQGELLLIEASFPGDLSSYGIRVTDANGVIHHFRIQENLSGIGHPFYLSPFDP